MTRSCTAVLLGACVVMLGSCDRSGATRAVPGPDLRHDSPLGRWNLVLEHGRKASGRTVSDSEDPDANAILSYLVTRLDPEFPSRQPITLNILGDTEGYFWLWWVHLAIKSDWYYRLEGMRVRFYLAESPNRILYVVPYALVDNGVEKGAPGTAGFVVALARVVYRELTDIEQRTIDPALWEKRRRDQGRTETQPAMSSASPGGRNGVPGAP